MIKTVCNILLSTILLAVFAQAAEAQLFGRLLNRDAQSCAGSRLFTGRIVSSLVSRRAARVQARTAGCGGVMAQPTVTSGCGGTVSFQEYVPSIVNVETHAPVQVAPICIGGQCIVNQPAPTKSFPKANTVPDQLFGLSAANDAIAIPNHILAQIATETTFGLETTIPNHVLGQIDSQPVKVADSFRPSLLKAIAEGRKSGKLSVRDAVKLRVACLSPAFVERAHELAVTQMAFSGEASEFVPLNDEGMIQTQGINWEGLAKFLEAFIPLLITLLKAFGM